MAVKAVVALAIALRLVFFLASQPWDGAAETDRILQSDALGHHILALSILDGEFSQFGQPEALRTPLYPAFIAGIYAVFGPRPWVVMLFQILLDAASVWLICRAFGSWIPGAFLAANPISIFFCSALYSEQLLMVCIAAALFALRNGRPATAGFMVGLAALTKPIALYLPIVLIGWLIYRYRRAVPALILTAVFTLTITPWIARNYVTFGTAGFSTSGGYNMLMLYGARMIASRDRLEFRQVQRALSADFTRRANPFERTAEMKARAFEIFADHPALFVKTYVAGIVRMFVNLNTRGVARALGVETTMLSITEHESAAAHLRAFTATRGLVHIAIGAVTTAYLLALYGVTAWGFVTWCRAPDRFGWLCAAGAVLFIALAGSAGLGRFLLPAMVFFLYFTRPPTTNWARTPTPDRSPQTPARWS
ncbi:MAG: glycosyltransferase family 39 protein [Alphaproteobacteria bacterium]|nr:glycosyltransferase family 39 protein [Alphaproteobacteria bacterium]